MFPIPKCGSIFDHFVTNILQNEKQYLYNFTDLQKSLIVKNLNNVKLSQHLQKLYRIL